MTKHHFTWLALGDSYTIGEGVPLYASYPYQTLQLLRRKHFHFHAPEIIAKTAWTTFELADQLLHTTLSDQYDFVTLLIGVNNQYRELSVEEYKEDLEFLVKKAIHLAGGNNSRVILISIPDWGVTPFAKDRDSVAISAAIDSFNAVKETLASAYKIHFINITPATRKAKDDLSLVTIDHLHPSASAYSEWATMLCEQMIKTLQ